MSARPFRHSAWWLALCLPLHVTQTHAEDAAAQRERLDAIVVTAQAPGTGVTTELDPKLPRQPVPASDGADYLKTIPGFTALRNGGTNGDPVLRGMYGSRLNLVSNDGAMPGACPARMDNPLSYIAPETFDKLIVVKGPQTVLWGPGASAGTVRFDRDAPQFDKPGMEASGSVLGGSHGRRDAVIDASAGATFGYARLTANQSEADDYESGDGQRVPSLWDKWNADLALGITPDENTVLEVGIGRGDGQARYAGRGMDGAQFLRDSQTLKFEKTGLSGALESIEASAWRNLVDHVMDNYTLREPNPDSMMAMPMAADVERRTVGGRVALHWMWAQFDLTAGADAQNSRHRQRSAMGRNTYSAVPWSTDAVLRHRGVFAEAGFGQSRDGRWIAGLRADRASANDRRVDDGMGMGGGMGMGDMPGSTSGQTRERTLGSGFLRYESQSADGFGWFAGLGHVRRFPDYWELFSPDAGPMGAINAFDGVQPERTTQLDVGTSYRNRRVDAWITAYAGRIDDYILFAYHAGGMMGMSSSAANVDARIHGAEAGVEFRPLDAVKLGSTLAWAWGENADANTPLPQMPPLELRLSAAYQAQRWNLGLLWRAVAAQDRVAIDQGNVVGRDLSPSPGFATLAINGSMKLGERFRFSAGIDNLLDRAYSEHLNLAGSADFGYPAEPVRILEPGRTAWVKLDFAY